MAQETKADRPFSPDSDWHSLLAGRPVRLVLLNNFRQCSLPRCDKDEHIGSANQTHASETGTWYEALRQTGSDHKGNLHPFQGAAAEPGWLRGSICIEAGHLAPAICCARYMIQHDDSMAQGIHTSRGIRVTGTYFIHQDIPHRGCCVSKGPLHLSAFILTSFAKTKASCNDLALGLARALHQVLLALCSSHPLKIGSGRSLCKGAAFCCRPLSLVCWNLCHDCIHHLVLQVVQHCCCSPCFFLVP